MNDLLQFVDAIKNLDALGAIIIIVIFYKMGWLDKKLFKKNGNGNKNGIAINPEKDNPKISQQTFLDSMEKVFNELKKKASSKDIEKINNDMKFLVTEKDFNSGMTSFREKLEELKEKIHGPGGVATLQSEHKLTIALIQNSITDINKKLDTIHSLQAYVYEYSDNLKDLEKRCRDIHSDRNPSRIDIKRPTI